LAWVARVPNLGVGVACDVEIDRLCQRGEFAVVKEPFALRHVSQARHFEGAATLRLGGQIGSHRSAQTFVVKARHGVGRNLCIARHAEVVVTEIGEQCRGRVVWLGAGVARGAIAFVGTVEPSQPFELLGREGGLALVDRIKGAKLAMVPSAHIPPTEIPEQYLKTVLPFLKS
jgi:hypothetical protein